MPNTARGYPYPLGSDDADVPADLQALAQAVNDDVDTVEAAHASDADLAAHAADSTAVHGIIDTAVLLSNAAVSDASNVRRGKSIIATEESRTNTAYGTLTTPDQVASVVLPADGLIAVAFSGMFKSSVAAAGNVAIFIGSNQLKRDAGGTGPAVQEVATLGTDSYRHVYSTADGLLGTTGVWTGDVTTGQTMGGCVVFAAAGTYTVSVQFKASSGSVTAKERKLWVKAEGF